MSEPAPDRIPLPLPSPSSFHYEERNRVGIITLDRPDRFNALTFAVYRELTDFFAVIDRRALAPEGARALVLQGRGKAFCSGGDVEDIIGHLFARDTDGLLSFTRMTGELIHNMRRCRLPIVASVKRVAAGAGAVMALASDLRVMGHKAFFAFLFPQVGLSGADMGASWLLPRLVGLGIASEILLLGDRVLAPRCERIGLANALVDDDDPEAVDRAAFALAERIAAGPHFAARMTKQMLGAELELPLSAAIEAEAQAQTICMQHPDFREAHEAWKGGRKPAWK
ncbi:MAG: enoyl-CoA hydratase family protein [Deltaproteobacteria bacterium]|nr:enoyl-CoA hydratase family protein [Nannocystaceae bacterium]